MFRRVFLLLSIIIVAASTLGSPAISLSYGYDQVQWAPGMMTVLFNNPSKGIDMSFVLPSAMNGKKLSMVKFYAWRVEGSGLPFLVRLHGDANGLPAAGILSQAIVNVTGAGWITATIAPIDLIAGVRYHVVIRPANGSANSANFVHVGYELGHYRQDMSLLLDLGSGWFARPGADPSLILQFSDGSLFGQPFHGTINGYSVYGLGANREYGQVFSPPSSMTVRRVSFLMWRTGNPPGNAHVRIVDGVTQQELCNEVFASADEVSPWMAIIHSRVLAAPVSLLAGRSYRLSLAQEGGLGDSSNCYIVAYQPNGDAGTSFGGSQSYSFEVNALGQQLNHPSRDTYFRLDTGAVELVRLAPFCVTQTSVTIVAESNLQTDAVVEYGTSRGYSFTHPSIRGKMHRFELSGLLPGTLYHYRILLYNPGDPTDTVSSGDCTFKTSSDTGSFDVTVIGETQSLDSHSLVDLASSYPHDLVLTVGDNVAVNTDSPYDTCMKEWRRFLSEITPLTRNGVLYTTLGNHDSYHLPTHPGPLKAYQDSVVMPSNGSGDGRYYSFDYGSAHFVVMDTLNPTNPINSMPASEITWLQNDLAASNKPWKIALCHLNIYGLSQDEQVSWWRITNWSQVHSVLKAGGVDLVLQGHRHVFNRFYKDGICYVTNSALNLASISSSPEGWEQGLTGMPASENYGGDAGSWPAYVPRSGWTQLSVSQDRLTCTLVDCLGRSIDSFSVHKPVSPDPSVLSPAQAKKKNLGAEMTVRGIVTSGDGDWTDRVYIEDSKRVAGIAVASGQCDIPARGQLVEVTGTLQSVAGEFTLNASAIFVVETAQTPGPLHLNTGRISGNSLSGLWSLSNEVKTIGLLVRVMGKIEAVLPDENAFYVNDGSNVLAYNGVKGIRVEAESAFSQSVGKTVSVTGISGCKYIGGSIYRVLRTRAGDDIQPVD